MKRTVYTALLIFFCFLSYAMEEKTNKDCGTIDDFESIDRNTTVEEMSLKEALSLLVRTNIGLLSTDVMRYAWKQTLNGQQTLVGIGDNEPEKAKTEAIYKGMITALEEGKEDHQLTAQFLERQKITNRLSFEMISKIIAFNKTQTKTPDEIGSMVTLVANANKLKEINSEYVLGPVIIDLMNKEIAKANKTIKDYLL